MRPLGPPSILFEERLWPDAELAAMASAWWAVLRERLGPAPGPVALPMANHPEAVALLFALSGLPAPVIVLPGDLDGWRCAVPFPASAHLLLPPALGHASAAGERLGLRVTRLPDAAPGPARPAAPFMTAPGFVFFTSGSTGLPRPVYRTTAQVLAGGRAPAGAIALPPRGGVLTSLPLDRTFGMHHGLLLPAALGRPMALLRSFRHHQTLALFASGDYQYWAATPIMASALVRCALPPSAPRPHPAPRFCLVGGPLSTTMSEAFRERFGVPLRPYYGTTETAGVAMDTAPAPAVRPEIVGRPMPGVEVRIGDDPRQPVPRGTAGRVWIVSPGCAPGYGFPPDIEPLPGVDGWWASPDVGLLEEDGSLRLIGRADDCVRTAAGHVVSPSVIAGALEAYPEVSEAVVVPLGAAAEPVLGALIETPLPVAAERLRDHLARSLPPWSRPRLIEQTRRLPRLPSGKPDRMACIALLERAALLSRGG